MVTSNGIDGAGAQATPVTPKGPAGPPVTTREQDEQAKLPRETASGPTGPGRVPAQVYDETGQIQPPPAGTEIDWQV